MQRRVTPVVVDQRRHREVRVVLADLSPAVHDAAEEIGGIGVQADITDPDDVTRLFDTTERVDVLVNNAGIITISRLEELTLDDWDRVLRVNTTGTFLCCQAAAARMRAQGHDLLYWENVEGGHGGAADNAQRAQMMALAFAFLWMQLGKP